MDENKVFTTKEIAKIYNITRQQVVLDIRFKKLIAKKYAGVWLVDEIELKNYRIKVRNKKRANKNR